jgi:hypothetical protein
MTSVVSGTSGYQQVTKPKLDHDICTTVDEELREVKYTRTVHAGASVLGAFRVCAMWTEDGRNTPLPVQTVESYQEYAAGCKAHSSGCAGHFCKTPRGSVLLPQKMASTVGVMSNDYAKMAESIFNRDTRSQELVYRERMGNTMLGKSGGMRGAMPSGVVDGSGREVIATCWELESMSSRSPDDTLYFAVPRAVACNMRVLREEVDPETGLRTGVYTEDILREGDYVLCVRPPSLWAGNVQPMRVVLWDHECFGLAPSLAADFHADHDGDEMQIYFVQSESAVQECKSWKRLTPNIFDCVRDVRAKRRSVGSGSDLPANIHEGSDDLVSRFMQHTTISLRELELGERMPDCSRLARVKGTMASMLAERLKNPQGVCSQFVGQSRRGIKDVMAQQLDQGILGDMFRQARLAASCVQYRGDGVFSIKVGSSTVRTVNTTVLGISLDSAYPLGGNSCMRAIAKICSVAQQAALDSHRVSQATGNDIDLIHDLMQGDPLTLVVLRGRLAPGAPWKYYDPNESVTYALVDPTNARSLVRNVIGAYSPQVLKAVKLVGGDVRAVCQVGISTVCNYYSIQLSQLELASVVELMIYRSDTSTSPITSKAGMSARELRWMATVFANHYGRLKSIQRRGLTRRAVLPETITEAAALGNYSYL